MPLTNTPETLNILDPDFRMPEHCGGDRWSILHGDSLQILRHFVCYDSTYTACTDN